MSNENEATDIVETENVVNEEVGVDDTDASGTIHSFDDLDELTTETNAEALLNEAKEYQEKGSKDSPPPEKESLPDSTKDEGEESKAPEEEVEDEIEETKYRKSTFEDISQEIAEESLFSAKVDGEEVDVSLKDLLENYSGKVAYDKRFNELNVSRKDLEKELGDYKTDKNAVDAYINDFAEKMKKGDAMGAISFLSEFAGMTPYEFRDQLLKNISPEVDRRRNLSPEQSKIEQIEAQNEYLQQKHESEQQKVNQQRITSELEVRITELQETHGISEDDFDLAYMELKDTDLAPQLTPDLVAKYCVQKNAFIRADQLVKEVEPQLSSNEEVVDAVQKLIVENFNFDDKALKDIVSSVYKDEIAKVSKTVSKKAGKKKSKKQPTGTSEDYENYADFEDL